MLLTIDTNDRRAIYQQVADGLKAMIARGDLAEGTALPPVRQLAADLGVNLNTIAAAYRELQGEGLIAIRHGSGAVVASSRTSEVSDEELRRTLQTALTQLALAGLPRARMRAMIEEELGKLGGEKGAGGQGSRAGGFVARFARRR